MLHTFVDCRQLKHKDNPLEISLDVKNVIFKRIHAVRDICYILKRREVNIDRLNNTASSRHTSDESAHDERDSVFSVGQPHTILKKLQPPDPGELALRERVDPAPAREPKAPLGHGT